MRSMQLHTPELGPLAHRIRGEFREMPGLRLTRAQACRLWHIDTTRCEAILDSLVDARFLMRLPDGSFVRA
jgi:hypothetical protein